MGNAIGLAADSYTWPISVVVILVWAASAMVCPRWWQRRLWAVPMSLFGFVWLGFGLNFVVRYALLSYDSVLFGNLTYRLADRPAAIVNETLLLAGGYWLFLVVGYAALVRVPGRGLFVAIEPLADPSAQVPRFLLTAICTACIALGNGPFDIPLAFITPLGVVGRLWVLPAGLAWWDHYRGREPLGGTPARMASLFPGVLQVALSPYREHLLLVVLLPFVAGLFAGRRYRLSVVAAGAVTLVLGSTVLVNAARMVQWSGYSVDEVLAEDLWGGSDPTEVAWLQALRRFHGFDSLLLTVDRVPSDYPFEDRQVFFDAALRAFVPRLFYENKELVQRGFDFSTTIWTDRYDRENPAAIAPSMAGDLYRANGPMYVLLGGLVWGMILGLCDGWAQRASPGVGAVSVLLFGALSFASVERDFVLVVGTLVQTLIVMTALGWSVGMMWRVPGAVTRGVPASRRRDRGVAVRSGSSAGRPERPVG
ncbi:hypothetical protein L6Q96_03840 [Candidatus Binatia bacterium]|nr:hypothetical protein [Candidatus Binatia bacterium]